MCVLCVLSSRIRHTRFALVTVVQTCARPIWAGGAQGVARNVADVFGIPVDIATGSANAGLGAANMLTGSDFQRVTNPIGGSDQIADIFASAAESAGYPVPDPQRDMSRQERIAFTVNRLGAGALTGVAAAGRTGEIGRAACREGWCRTV